MRKLKHVREFHNYRVCASVSAVCGAPLFAFLRSEARVRERQTSRRIAGHQQKSRVSLERERERELGAVRKMSGFPVHHVCIVVGSLNSGEARARFSIGLGYTYICT